MRTIKRYSLKINKNKWQQLREIAKLYRDEKNFHLRFFNQDKNYGAEADEIIRRNFMVKEKYKPATGLQARQWKIALTEAHDTVNKNWCALAAEIKTMISRRQKEWTDSEMHYGYWLVFSGKRLAELVAGKAPEPEGFTVSYAEKKRVRNYIRRVVRRKRGLRPVAHRTRSFILDANMYSVVENVEQDGKKAQFIKIMGLAARQRVVIPLTGYTNIGGTLKIVLDFYKRRIEVHTSNSVIPPENQSDIVVALDAGITEVFTDEQGNAYEPTFGKTLKIASDQLNKAGKGRNSSNALKKVSSKFKARRISKFNLGRNKLRNRRRKARIRIEQQISQAIRTVVKNRKPSVIVTERLDIRGKAKSKKMSRLVHYWMCGSLQERLGFLALAEGFRHKQVNPAYTSQCDSKSSYQLSSTLEKRLDLPSHWQYPMGKCGKETRRMKHPDNGSLVERLTTDPRGEVVFCEHQRGRRARVDRMVSKCEVLINVVSTNKPKMLSGLSQKAV
jgi:putative transposase